MQTSWLLGVSLGLLSLGCSDEAAPDTASASASAPVAATVKPTATSTASAQPSASAAPAPPSKDCPKDSVGPGTLAEPCEAKGTTRLMEARYTGKTDDKGPHFNVVNKATLPILYGKIVVYFYDKAGKQLEVEDKQSSKKLPYRVCAGSNLFSGVMKVGEKAVLTFSCVAQEHVPEGTDAIEAELMTVGFADATGTKNELYWANRELTPDVRPKGGVKK